MTRTKQVETDSFILKIIAWEDGPGLLATERGRARAFELPDDIVTLELAEKQAWELKTRMNYHSLAPFERADGTYDWDAWHEWMETDSGEYFADRARFREQLGYAEAIHERIAHLKWGEPLRMPETYTVLQ